MISKLSLTNFKTHKDTVLEFSPGINIITGDSGHGKTNILLGLQWVKDNRPLGVGCIRRGQDSSTAIMEVVDNKDVCGIIRNRGKSKNEYRIEKNGKASGDPFKTSFPPKEVSDILNLSDINIQKQRDQHFLVYTSPGQVATYVRSITKLDEIDQVVKLLRGKISSERGELSHCQKDLESTNDELIVLNKIDLELLESKIVEAKDRMLKIEQAKEKIERIGFIVNELMILEENRIVIPDTVDEIFEDVDVGQKEIVRVSSCLSKLRTLVDRIKEIEVHEIVLPEDLTILSTVETVSEEFDNQCVMLDKLQTLNRDLRAVIVKIEDYDKQICELEEEERLLKEQLQSCPSCGTELTEESKVVLLER